MEEKLMRFKDRAEAGRLLADALSAYKDKDVVVYALPRGGVVPAVIVAQALKCPLDLLIVRKIGHPFQPELAVCAIAEDGDELCGEMEQEAFREEEWFKDAAVREQAEAKRRREAYLGDKSPLIVKGRTAIIVDDGVATGLTMRLAIREIRHREPLAIMVATPVISKEAAEDIKKEVDVLVALDTAEFMMSVGASYDQFPQIEDDEVKKLLSEFSKQ